MRPGASLVALPAMSNRRQPWGLGPFRQAPLHAPPCIGCGRALAALPCVCACVMRAATGAPMTVTVLLWPGSFLTTTSGRRCRRSGPT
jgi:hypothetical protein